MTAQSDLKLRIRDRQAKTGESYSTARAHVLRARAEILGLPTEPTTSPSQQREAVVLKVNRESARVRVFGEDVELTFRTAGAYELIPGQIATLRLDKRWTYRDDAYASGRVEAARIDIARLGLEALPLHGGDLVDLRKGHEPYRRPDPYAPLWRTFTARRRRAYEMDAIAWGAFPGADPEDNPTCDAAELREAGDDQGAYKLLMQALHRDLRCIDAHAQLGNIAFDRLPERALLHYEIGIAISELSLPTDFDGVLEWGLLYNRPFLRCLHGLGLCRWRLGRFAEAERVFLRLLSLSPNDNLGARFNLADVRAGRTWEDDSAQRASNASA